MTRRVSSRLRRLSSARILSLVGLLALAACSERYVAVADGDLLVVVDDVSQSKGRSAAEVHYSLASPMALDGPEGEKAVGMIYEAVFDCQNRTWGHTAQHLTTDLGSKFTNHYPQAVMETPKPGSVGSAVVEVVCSPAARTKAATRRPLRSIQRDYKERTVRPVE